MNNSNAQKYKKHGKPQSSQKRGKYDTQGSCKQSFSNKPISLENTEQFASDAFAQENNEFNLENEFLNDSGDDVAISQNSSLRLQRCHSKVRWELTF